MEKNELMDKTEYEQNFIISGSHIFVSMLHAIVYSYAYFTTMQLTNTSTSNVIYILLYKLNYSLRHEYDL